MVWTVGEDSNYFLLAVPVTTSRRRYARRCRRDDTLIGGTGDAVNIDQWRIAA